MKWLDSVENFLITIVSRIAPWAAPLAPAYLVARSIQTHFEAPLIVGIAVGVTLEAVGVASAHITLEMHDYNTDPARVKDDPRAPFKLGLGMVGIYFVTGFVLTVLLEVVPDSVKIAPALFFILAGVAYITLTLISGHSRRLDTVRDNAEKRKKPRALSGQVSAPVRKWPDKTAFLSDPDRTEYTAAQVKEMAGVTGRTARRWVFDAQNGKE